MFPLYGSSNSHYRYDIIATLLDHYSRPITILDLGATDDWLINEIARCYCATLVIVSRDRQENLANFCINSPLCNLILLKKELSLAHLERLAECEHFDVALVLDDFNALPLMRKKAITLLVNVADYTLLSVPYSKKQKGLWTRADEIRRFICDAHATVLQEILLEDATIFVVYKPKTFLKRSYWNNPLTVSDGEYLIKSAFDEKYLYKRSTDKLSVWQSGVNLHTFKALSGVYPTHDMLLDMLESVRDFDHNDYNPCNFVIQGKSLTPIDLHDPRRSVDHMIGYERLRNLLGCGDSETTL